MWIDYDGGELMGLPAVQRANRGIVLIIRDAIDHIVSLGWDRDRDIAIVPENEDDLPSIDLCGKRVFEVRLETSFDPMKASWSDEPSPVRIQGRWLCEVSGPGTDRTGWWRRTWRRLAGNA